MQIVKNLYLGIAQCTQLILYSVQHSALTWLVCKTKTRILYTKVQSARTVLVCKTKTRTLYTLY